MMALAAALLLVGCAKASLDQNAPRPIGRATQRDISIFVPQALNRHGYAVVDYRETRNTIYFATAWEHRAPFEDEAEDGATQCRTRITVEARKGGGEMYAVTLRVENAALGSSPDAQWRPVAATPMFQGHVRAITSAIQLHIDAGVRVHE